MTDLEKRIKKEVREWWVTDSNYSKLLSLETLIKNIVRDETDLLSQHILDLQKDKGNLTDRVRELEQQIEKMKNWCNCKNYQQCLIELAEQGKGMYPSECCRNCKKWEMKEND